MPSPTIHELIDLTGQVAVITGGARNLGLDMATALAEAQGDSSRVLHICSSLDRAFAGREVGALHELVDQSGVLKSVVKWHRSVRRVSEIPDVIAEALHYMQSGRPGPASVEIPLDILAERDDVTLLSVSEPGPLAPDAGAVAQTSENIFRLAGQAVGHIDETKLLEAGALLEAAQTRQAFIGDRFPLRAGGVRECEAIHRPRSILLGNEYCHAAMIA